MENKKELRTWLDDFQLNHPLVIAGPCSAETEDQVLKIAHELKNSDVSIFRAGIWKPRTRPGGFEGVGEIGLKWLQKAKAETGLLMAIEVATAAHVKLALEHDIDVLWIGARTTVNPFAVQEIADALQGTDKIVLLKNPVNPDLSLWIGGLERLYNANIKKLGVIHRGFSTYEKTKYRNIPEWQLAIELQNRFPDLPLICDPSHITGKRDMIQEVSQQALDLNYDGLIIETHIDPDNAWSDAAQQVTPTVLKQIFIIQEINQNFRRENQIDNNKLIDSLQSKEIPTYELVDNYYDMLFTAVGNKNQPFNFSKNDFKLNSYNLKDETEKVFFFLKCMGYCGTSIWGYINIPKPPNTKTAMEYINKYPKFNGQPYYQYTDFYFKDFEMIIITDNGKESYKGYYINKYYETLLNHLFCLIKEESTEKEKNDLLLGSILKESNLYKYTKLKDTLEEIFEARKRD